MTREQSSGDDGVGLAQKIEDTRITYPEVRGGVTISGAAFLWEFNDPVDPQTFCDEITTAEAPWQMFGVKTPLSDDYWKVVGNLFHVEGGQLLGSSKISLEVAPEWVRIYVKEGCSANRAASFVRTLNSEYGGEVVFADGE